jgi:AcrR family transcriptional regulator
MVDDILTAALRVWGDRGPEGFNTVRVAEVAGVSIGSLYQYFPNKEALLFRLQVAEWERTRHALSRILADERVPAARRLRALVRAFFQSEVDEAPLRTLLDRSAPHYLASPEARALRDRSGEVVSKLVRELVPGAAAGARRRAERLLFLVLGGVGRDLGDSGPTAREVRGIADAVSGMLLGHFAAEGRGSGRSGKRGG